MNPDQFELAKRRESFKTLRYRESVIKNLSVLLYRTRHRFTVDEWIEIDYQFKRAGIVI